MGQWRVLKTYRQATQPLRSVASTYLVPYLDFRRGRLHFLLLLLIEGAFNITKTMRLYFEGGSFSGNAGEWVPAFGITVFGSGISFDAGLMFFPGRERRMLPAFAIAKRF